jgi:hypothetical protein
MLLKKGVCNLALFCLATVLATFQKIGQFFTKSSGHPELEHLTLGMMRRVLYHCAATNTGACVVKHCGLVKYGFCGKLTCLSVVSGND